MFNINYTLIRLRFLEQEYILLSLINDNNSSLSSSPFFLSLKNSLKQSFKNL